MGLRDYLLDRYGNLDIDELDFTGLYETSEKVHMKKIAVSTCSNFLARTISQAEFRELSPDGEYKKGEVWYRLNVRPNQNQTASEFWQEVIHKLITNNEVLIIQDDYENLQIADSFTRKHYALYEDKFHAVTLDEHVYTRTFNMSDVIYLKYSSEDLYKLFGELHKDYGELYARVLEYQKRKNQIRATVNISQIQARDSDEKRKILQTFVDKAYKAISDGSVAIIPQQKGIEYQEHNSGNAVTSSGVEEINKTTDGYLDRVAMALGVPIAIIHGETTNVEGQVDTYLKFTIDPILKMIRDELNAKLFTKEEIIAGQGVEVKELKFKDIFDIASSVDKLISSGAFTGNEIRHAAGYDKANDPNLDKHYITKNYTEIGTDPQASQDVTERSDSSA